MNVYDKINELSDAIRNCSEFKDYLKKKEEAYKNPEHKELIVKFRDKQIELQQLAFEGDEAKAKEKTEILQTMYQMLLQNEKIKEMFDAEVKFDVLIGDMYRILGDTIKKAMED